MMAETEGIRGIADRGGLHAMGRDIGRIQQEAIFPSFWTDSRVSGRKNLSRWELSNTKAKIGR